VARLLADENFPFPVTQELRRLGHDVVTLEDLGKVDQRLLDDAVLALATEQDRAVLTINRRHFVRLHQERPEHAGIVVCSLDIDFEGQAKRIAAALEGEETEAGKLFRINRPG
jgi:hypothetical protein